MKNIIIVFLLVIILSTTACQQNREYPHQEIKYSTMSEKNVVGNTPQNIINGGELAVQGDWLYYRDNNGIYKLKRDGTKITKITEDDAYGSINVLGDWLYYIMNDSLYMMRTNGQDKSVVVSGCANAFIKEDTAYFNSPENFNLQSISLTSPKSLKLENHVMDFCMIDDYIYYVHYDENTYEDSLYRMSADGNNSEEIEKNIALYIIIGDNVFCVELNNYTIEKINMKTMEKKSILDLEDLENEWGLHSMNTDGEYLYFTQGKTNGVYQMGLDGSSLKLLYTDLDIADNLYAFGNEIYVIADNNDVFRIYADGRPAAKLS